MPRLLLPPSAAREARAGGTVVAVAGVAIAAAGWAFLPSDPGVAGLFFLVQKVLLTAFGAAFVALGLVVGWSRVGAGVDRKGGRLLLFRRVLVWQRGKEVPLGRIRRLEVVGGNDPAGRGPGWIELHLGGGLGKLTFGLGQSAAALRRLAAWIRDWSGLPAEVFAGMEPGQPARVLAPEEIEVRRALERLDAWRGVEVDRGPRRLVVEALSPGWRGMALVMAAVAAGAAALVAVFARQALRSSHTEPPALAALALFAAFPVAFLLAAVHVARRRLTIAVEEGALRVEIRGAFRTRRETLPAGEVGGVEMVFLGREGTSRWGLVVLGTAREPRLTLSHPALDRRREAWEAVAVLLREALAAAAS